ncbi:MFS transporter, partial [Variovorax sp. CT11-76]
MAFGLKQHNGNSVATTPPARAGLAQWAGLAMLALPTMLLGLDVTLLYLALPKLAEDLQPSATQALWIMDAYGFMIAGFLVTMGALGDAIGRRRLLLIGAAAFAVTSVLAAFAPSANLLIAARALLGIAGAALMPSTLALIRNMFLDARQRALAIGVWATMFAFGMAAGPLVGGLLLAHFWWGSAFLVAIPVVLLLWIGGPFLLPEYRAPGRARLDLASVALSLAAILPLVYVVKQSAKSGWGIATTLALLLGIACAIAFVRRQRALANPLLDIGLFADRSFSVALGVLLVGLTGVGGALLLVTQYLQLVIGLPPVTAGLWMAPTARATQGLGWAVAGYALIYLGLGTLAALGTDLVIGAAPAAHAGSASALSETVQELGVALGVAIFGSLTTVVYRAGIAEHLPRGLPEQAARAVEEGLWSATSLAQSLPAGLLDEARHAFVAGLGVSSA